MTAPPTVLLGLQLFWSLAVIAACLRIGGAQNSRKCNNAMFIHESCKRLGGSY